MEHKIWRIPNFFKKGEYGTTNLREMRILFRFFIFASQCGFVFEELLGLISSCFVVCVEKQLTSLYVCVLLHL
jgi:hypothetical protein